MSDMEEDAAPNPAPAPAPNPAPAPAPNPAPGPAPNPAPVPAAVLYDQGHNNVVEAWHARQISLRNGVHYGGDHPLPELVDLDQPPLQGTHFGFVIFFISMLILTQIWFFIFFLFEYCKTLYVRLKYYEAFLDLT